MSLSRSLRLVLAGALTLGGSSCSKVPIFDVNAFFTRADVSWFAEEETLFLFYEVTAEQGISEQSIVEITYLTDDERVDWTPVDQLENVHTHLDVDCGINSLCGSNSVSVELEPREVGVRLRYHREGKLALDTDSVFNVVGLGSAHAKRSLLVYGVFDERNELIQWRSRHQFPTLRNEEAEDYGLRRWFHVEDQRHGNEELATNANPYAYGAACPGTFSETSLEAVETTQRAVFNDELLPLSAADHSAVCAQSTVTDAKGTFTTGAVARKNPQVRAAFPVVRSPVHDATHIQFFLAPCERTISEVHEEMQRQRLLMEDTPTTCIDDWQSPDFVDELTIRFRDAVEDTRPEGEDMVLVVGLHHDDPGLAEVVEEALAEVVPAERLRSSPRLAGSFVFDSEIHDLGLEELEPVTLWCPADIPGGADIPDASNVYCAILPDNPEFELGPLSFSTLPIFPDRDGYLDFIDTYSKKQAGEVNTLDFRVPEFATTSDHIAFEDIGVATFFEDEAISADPEDAFSYCVTEEEPWVFVFRSPALQSEEFLALLEQECAAGNLPEDFCATASQGLLPIQWLGEWHSAFAEDTYELGLFWDFPFLLRMEYLSYTAGSISALGLSVPFGLGAEGEAFYGTAMWTVDEFSLEKTLTQCRRWCDHPTFDSAGVYHVTDSFRDAYAQACYLPDYPQDGDSGFPLDP